MKEVRDGGEAILEALRSSGVDFIISSPGSEWPPVWEALARQQANEVPGPKYINCWHESLAVAMAMGYTACTARPQAVLLHTGVGLLQGSMAIQGAQRGEVPMVICSGESTSYGEDPEFDPGPQWYQSLSVAGGPARLVEHVVKWSSQVNSPYLLYDTITRSLEMAQRVPKGPVYVSVPMEVMIQEWTPRGRGAKVTPAPKLQPSSDVIQRAAEALARSRDPVIVTETAGRNVEAFEALVQLAELLAIPVVEANYPVTANFPKSQPLHLGYSAKPFMDRADLFLLVGCKDPWYPPSAAPAGATSVIVVDENPIKTHMAYQSLQADLYIEGDVGIALRLVLAAVKSAGRIDDGQVRQRRERWAAEHNKQHEEYRSAAKAGEGKVPIDPAWLCSTISEVMPKDTTYVEETIVHRPLIMRHIDWNLPQSYFHPTGGLGLGLGMALGVKLALPQRPVVALMGDGSFLYNPIVPCLGAAREHGLPLLIVVFNNGKYASMQRGHTEFYPQGVAVTRGLFFGAHIPGPEYAGLVEPFGGYGVKVEEPDELKPALAEALAAVKGGRTALVDVVLAR